MRKIFLFLYLVTAHGFLRTAVGIGTTSIPLSAGMPLTNATFSAIVMVVHPKYAVCVVVEDED